MICHFDYEKRPKINLPTALAVRIIWTNHQPSIGPSVASWLPLMASSVIKFLLIGGWENFLLLYITTARPVPPLISFGQDSVEEYSLEEQAAGESNYIHYEGNI